MMKKTCYSITNCSEARIPLFVKNGYPIVRCGKCGHTYTEIIDPGNHVRQVYSDDYFFKGKAGYPNYLNQKDLLYQYGTRYAEILSRYTKPGKVLDTGCAVGYILKGFEDSGWEGQGIEPNETMAGYGRKELNLHITTASLETYESCEKFDLVNIIQVIGHFYDLDAAVQKVSDLLKDNGMVLVESWNMKSWFARIMGNNWHEYSPPSVVHWFSDETLSEFFDFYGFELIAKGYPPKKINMMHALSLIEEKTFQFSFKKRLFHSLAEVFGKYTVRYPPLDLKWYLFRKT